MGRPLLHHSDLIGPYRLAGGFEATEDGDDGVASLGVGCAG